MSPLSAPPPGRTDSDASYRELVEHANSIILRWSVDGRVLLLNECGQRFFGYTAEEIVGRHVVGTIVPTTDTGGRDLQLYIEEICASPEAFGQSINENMRRSGERVWVSWTNRVVRDGQGRVIELLSIGSDITERQRSEEALRQSEARYRALFERVPVGIVCADANSYYLDANDCVCQMLGYTRDELIGLHASDIIVPSEVPHIQSTLDQIHDRVDHRREWLFRRKNGSVFAADVTATAMPDGTLLGIIRDITALREREQEVTRMSRLYDALSHVNQAIVRLRTRDELLQKVCDVLVDHGGFRMAWVGWHVPEDHRLMPVAQCGDSNRYLDGIRVYTDDRPEGRGPSGHTFRSGSPYVSNDLLGDPVSGPWRAELERRGFLASAAFPIRVGGVVEGVLSVYADRLGFFQDQEVRLLEEAAADVSFALDNVASEAARRHAEQTVRQEKEFSDSMIECMPGIVYLYDMSGRFLRWNRDFERVSGFAATEIAHMHPLDFFAGDDKVRIEARISEVFATGESSTEASFVSRDGRQRPYYFTGRRVTFQGRTCLVGVGIDISERRQAEEERERRHRAEAADRVKSAFLATMSHELRTPLNSIIGFTGILLQGLAGPLNTEQNKQLEMVRTSSRHLLALINDVLDISKIEAGQLEVARAPFNPGQSIAKVVALVTPLAVAKGLAVRVEVPAVLPIVVGDARRFEQILLNLLSNAIKFTEMGEVRLTAKLLDAAGLDAGRPAATSIQLSVRDSGIGIKTVDLPHLFQPFRQVESGLARHHEGTGLGLAICHRLAVLMGGRIDAESEWGKGSRFWVTLPLEGPVRS